jgi:hypothetical protein
MPFGFLLPHAIGAHVGGKLQRGQRRAQFVGRGGNNGRTPSTQAQQAENTAIAAITKITIAAGTSLSPTRTVRSTTNRTRSLHVPKNKCITTKRINR